MPASVRPVNYVPIEARGVARGTKVREAAPGSPGYGFNPHSNNNKCVRHFYIEWQDDPEVIWTAATDFLGYSSIELAGSQKYISRTIPVDNPNFLLTTPGPPLDPGFFYAESIPTIEGSVPAGQDFNAVGTFDEAMLTVVYATFPYGILTDSELVANQKIDSSFPDEASLLRYVSMAQLPTAYYQTLPTAGSLRYVDGTPALPPRPAGTAMVLKRGVIIPEADVTITWHEIPAKAYPKTAIANCIGKSNAEDLGDTNCLLGTFPAGQLMLVGAKPEQCRLASGDFGLNVTYQFRRYPNPFGANGFYRFLSPTIGGQYQLATFDGTNTGPLLFPAADFNALFRPE